MADDEQPSDDMIPDAECAEEPISEASGPPEIVDHSPRRICTRFAVIRVMALLIIYAFWGRWISSAFGTFPRSDYYSAGLVGCAMAVGSLAAFWAVWGGRLHPWRLVAACGLLAAGALLLYRSPHRHLSSDQEQWLFCLEVSNCTAWFESMFFLILRWVGLELKRRDAGRGQWHRGRYSLNSLFQWVIGLAILLGILIWIPRQVMRDLLAERGLFFGILSTFSAGLSLLLIWMTLGRADRRWRIYLPADLLLFSMMIACVVFPPGGTYLGAMMVLLGVALAGTALWHGLALGLLRWAGYRLIWRGKTIV